MVKLRTYSVNNSNSHSDLNAFNDDDDELTIKNRAVSIESALTCFMITKARCLNCQKAFLAQFSSGGFYHCSLDCKTNFLLFGKHIDEKSLTRQNGRYINNKLNNKNDQLAVLNSSEEDNETPNRPSITEPENDESLKINEISNKKTSPSYIPNNKISLLTKALNIASTPIESKSSSNGSNSINSCDNHSNEQNFTTNHQCLSKHKNYTYNKINNLQKSPTTISNIYTNRY